MAELILSEDEKKSASYLAWDDAALGKAVKDFALSIQDEKGETSLVTTACATLLACMANERNAKQSTIDLGGVTENKTEAGDWRVTVERLAEPKTPKSFELAGVAVVIEDNYTNSAKMGVLFRQSDQKYLPFCEGQLGDPVSTEIEARSAMYQLLSAHLQNELDTFCAG